MKVNSKKCIDSRIQIYPNPTKSYVDITDLEIGDVVKISNVASGLIYTKKTDTKHLKVVAEQWKKGNYIVEIIRGSNIISSKKIILINTYDVKIESSPMFHTCSPGIICSQV